MEWLVCITWGKTSKGNPTFWFSPLRFSQKYLLPELFFSMLEPYSNTEGLFHFKGVPEGYQSDESHGIQGTLGSSYCRPNE